MGSIIRKISQFKTREIESLWNKARRVFKHDGLHILKAPQSGDFGRLLLIIPRKVGSAPVRNKLRRQLKHIFFENELFNNPHDWIIIIKKGASEIPFQELQKILLSVMSQSE